MFIKASRCCISSFKSLSLQGKVQWNITSSRSGSTSDLYTLLQFLIQWHIQMDFLICHAWQKAKKLAKTLNYNRYYSKTAQILF